MHVSIEFIVLYIKKLRYIYQHASKCRNEFATNQCIVFFHVGKLAENHYCEIGKNRYQSQLIGLEISYGIVFVLDKQCLLNTKDVHNSNNCIEKNTRFFPYCICSNYLEIVCSAI